MNNPPTSNDEWVHAALRWDDRRALYRVDYIPPSRSSRDFSLHWSTWKKKFEKRRVKVWIALHCKHGFLLRPHVRARACEFLQFPSPAHRGYPGLELSRNQCLNWKNPVGSDHIVLILLLIIQPPGQRVLVARIRITTASHKMSMIERRLSGNQWMGVSFLAVSSIFDIGSNWCLPNPTASHDEKCFTDI